MATIAWKSMVATSSEQLHPPNNHIEERTDMNRKALPNKQVFNIRICIIVVMKAVPLETPDTFAYDGRGPGLQHWLVDSDLLFDDSQAGFAPPSKSITGAQVDEGWVVFHGLQVIQIVPEEVHSYWHDDPTAPSVSSSVWHIENSTWMTSFHPRHLDDQHHYLITSWKLFAANYFMDRGCSILNKQ